MTRHDVMDAPDTPRDRLIAAAEKHFRRFGYRRTTVDDVTRSADTGKGTFYLHFESKEDAYVAVVEASLERFLSRAVAALQGPGTVPERLRSLVEVTAEHYHEDELLRASLFGETAVAGGPLVDGAVARRAAVIQRNRIRGLLAATLDAGQRDGTIRSSIDPGPAAAVVFEIGWAVVRAELEGTAEVSLDVALDTLNDIVGLGLITRTTRDRPT